VAILFELPAAEDEESDDVEAAGEGRSDRVTCGDVDCRCLDLKQFWLIGFLSKSISSNGADSIDRRFAK
jgi:hypothetical protein